MLFDPMDISSYNHVILPELSYHQTILILQNIYNYCSPMHTIQQTYFLAHTFQNFYNTFLLVRAHTKGGYIHEFVNIYDLLCSWPVHKNKNLPETNSRKQRPTGWASLKVDHLNCPFTVSHRCPHILDDQWAGDRIVRAVIPAATLLQDLAAACSRQTGCSKTKQNLLEIPWSCFSLWDIFGLFSTLLAASPCPVLQIPPAL